MSLKAVFRLTPLEAALARNRLRSVIAFLSFVLPFVLVTLPLWFILAFEENHFACALSLLLGIEQGRILNNLVLVAHGIDSALL